MLSCVGYLYKTSGWKTPCDRTLSLDGGHMWFLAFTL
jgi:hypothetical protein